MLLFNVTWSCQLFFLNKGIYNQYDSGITFYLKLNQTAEYEWEQLPGY